MEPPVALCSIHNLSRQDFSEESNTIQPHLLRCAPCGVEDSEYICIVHFVEVFRRQINGTVNDGNASLKSRVNFASIDRPVFKVALTVLK
jgi:hypothetical protein